MINESSIGYPLVSVILCTFNGQRFIAEQLSSLENQTYKNVEFICSDNNSTDTTSQILKDWCEKSQSRNFSLPLKKALIKIFIVHWYMLPESILFFVTRMTSGQKLKFRSLLPSMNKTLMLQWYIACQNNSVIKSRRIYR